MSVRLLVGDCREHLRALDDASVHTCVTSPPYFGLRDYGHAGQIGLEQTPDAFVAEMVATFRAVRRVLRDDGTLWLNLGDSYSSGGNGPGPSGSKQATNVGAHVPPKKTPGYGAKQLLGIPWRVALALQADGWTLRQDIIWSKPNPMPESVQDRCTRAHEYIFLFAKGPRYHFDAEAIRNPPSEALLQQVAQGYAGEDTKDYGGACAQSASGTKARVIAGARAKVAKQRGAARPHEGFDSRWDNLSRAEQQALGSNRRSVWTVATRPFSGAHFATFPPDLIEPCVLAGCPKGGTVLDPFAGAGTTGLVADRLQRNAVLIELNPDYAAIATKRLHGDAGMFSEVDAA